MLTAAEVAAKLGISPRAVYARRGLALPWP